MLLSNISQEYENIKNEYILRIHKYLTFNSSLFSYILKDGIQNFIASHW